MVNGAPATRRPAGHACQAQGRSARLRQAPPSAQARSPLRWCAERSSCRLCVLAPQRRSEAKAVDGRKPEQEGRERRLERRPAIGGANQPSHAATENPALETGGSRDGEDAKSSEV